MLLTWSTIKEGYRISKTKIIFVCQPAISNLSTGIDLAQTAAIFLKIKISSIAKLTTTHWYDTNKATTSFKVTSQMMLCNLTH